MKFKLAIFIILTLLASLKLEAGTPTVTDTITLDTVRDYHGKAYGYNTRDTCVGDCLAAGTQVGCSKYADKKGGVRGIKLRVCYIATLTDPTTGEVRDVSKDKLTIVTGMVKDGQVIPLPQNEIFTTVGRNRYEPAPAIAPTPVNPLPDVVPCIDNTCAGIGPVTEQVEEILPIVETPTQTELDAFFENGCKAVKRDTGVTCSPAEYQNYINEYKQYIELASKVFGVPFDLLACLFFKESKWGANSLSKTGAVGIGQFTNGGAGGVDDLINVPAQVYASCNPLRGADKEKCEASLAQIQNNSKYKQGWVTYFQTLLQDPEYAKRKTTVGGTYGQLGIPTAFTKNYGARMPPVAIAAAAVYLKYIMEDRVRPSVRAQMAADPVAAAKLTVGCYNAGDGLCARITSTLSSAWESTLAAVTFGYYKKKGRKRAAQKQGEVTRHMRDIGKCMTHEH